MAAARARWSLWALAGAFAAAGVMHFVAPRAYLSIMPPRLPQPLALVYLSGVLEVAGGVALLPRRTRPAAGVGLILLLAAVWPANFQMLRNARAAGVPGWQEALLWARLPLQPVLALWVWRAAGLRRRALSLTSSAPREPLG